VSPSQATPPNPLSNPLLGSIISGAVTAVVVTIIGEQNISSLSLLVAIVAGTVAGILSWFLLQWPSRWLEGWNFRERQRRRDVSTLQGLQSDIWHARQNLARALFHFGSVVDALQEMGDLDSKLLQLSITLPEFPPDYETEAFAEGWESFLDKLYPYARDGDTAGARRIGRLTWRARLSRRARESWRSLSRWCRFKVRRLRSNPKRIRRRGRRSGGARHG